MIAVLIIILLFLVLFIFWQGSLLYASVFTVPTVYANDKAICDAFELAGLSEGQLVVDLGCGNAKSLIIAAKKYRARGVGVDNSLYCYLKSKLNVWLAGQSRNIKIIFGDFKKAENDLKKADLVYLYLLNSVLSKIEPWYFSHIGQKTKTVILCFRFPGRNPVSERETRNLGRETTLRLYA